MTDDMRLQFDGRPLSELGLDKLEYHNPETGETRPITGFVGRPGMTVVEALQRDLQSPWEIREREDTGITVRFGPQR